MKKYFSGLLASGLLVGMLSACGTGGDAGTENGTAGEGKEDKKVLVMGTSADYPPFEYIDTTKSDEIIGFDIDLAKAITKELGYEVKVTDIDFSGLIPAIQAGKVDFVMSGMTPTEERKKNVDFSDIYYAASHLIVTKKDSDIKTVEDLKGKTVGVQTSSIQEGKAKELQKTTEFKIESRNRIPELVQEIKAGRFDAAIIEDVVAEGFFEKDKELVGFEVPGAAEDEAGSAIAFPKDSELREDFNRVLNQLIENGEVDKLIAKWFGGEN